MKKILTLVSLLCIFLCCSQENNASKTTDSQQKNILLADPTIFFDNGTYYLYGTTGGDTPLNGQGFMVYTSADLKRTGF
jgi:xylan 1,4-beta-xylosidase